MSRKIPPLFIIIFLLISSTLAQAVRVEYRFRINYVIENRGDDQITVPENYFTVIEFPDNEYQSVDITDSSHAISHQVEDDDENAYQVLDIDLEIPAKSNVTFYTVYTAISESKGRPDLSLEKSGLVSEIPGSLIEEYCVETETFNWTGIISELADDLAGNETSVYGITEKLVEWINENISYENYERPQYPIETYSKLEGDCDDQAILLISMLRSLGVPAYLQVGVIFHESIEGEKTVWEGHMTSSQEGIGWHGWAMVYTPPWGWIPVDLTMVSSVNPEDAMILAPQYGSYIVKAYDVSKQAYIGEGIEEMTTIINGDIYVSVEDIALSTPVNQGLDWMGILTVVVGVLAVVSIGYLIYTVTLRPRSSTEFLD